MKKLAVSIAALALSCFVLVSQVHGQTPPPPPGLPGNNPTATPAPTATPIPLTVSLAVAHKHVNAGSSQGIKVTTLPGASVFLQIAYPNHHSDGVKAAAGADGALAYGFVQPSVANHHKNAKVTVTVQVTFGAQSKTRKATYTTS
ncbi:MAG TPA: hypothetical protein VFB58_01935 [Chloroflexota bacterium]|nr:hypothetical protein [Chloroflexota bacterium]